MDSSILARALKTHEDRTTEAQTLKASMKAPSIKNAQEEYNLTATEVDFLRRVNRKQRRQWLQARVGGKT